MDTVQNTRLASTGKKAGASIDRDLHLTRIARNIDEAERRCSISRNGRKGAAREIRELRRRLDLLNERYRADADGWATVKLARHPKRPGIRDYIGAFVEGFCELHGDRCFGDDKAMVTGLGLIAGQRVMLIGHDKGRELQDKIACGFGSAMPEGYRKALAKMKLAEKFNLPVISLIDSPGAYPGIGSEERSVAQAIAVNLREMSRLRVPIICVVIGEGGSGGAIGIGVGDRIAMFSHSYYSVISPEGCAAILFGESSRAVEAADALKLTAPDLKRLGLIDAIIEEPAGGAHKDPKSAARELEAYLTRTIRDLQAMPLGTLIENRYDRLRQLGTCFVSNRQRTRHTNGLMRLVGRSS